MKDEKNYDVLKLDNQLCFPLYAVAREVVKKYRLFLEELNLTYTQYITMMVLWEENEVYVKELGEKLYLDSGTLTPVINALEKKGYVEKKRSESDKRDVSVYLTAEGIKLRDKALSIPERLKSCMPLNHEDAKELYRILKLLLENL